MDFYLGTDVQGLAWNVPVMVSHGRLRTRRSLPKASNRWACDSRGFTELSQHGRWTISPAAYADSLLRYQVEVGKLDWASPQDWMCEPTILAKTGKTVTDHQHLTIESCLTLPALAPGVPIIKVLQGWDLGSYVAHVEMYRSYGVDLRNERVVGLGSVCRRQRTKEIHHIVTELDSMDIRLHGFGIKQAAIASVGPLLTSADSEAWSLGARLDIRHCGHGLTKWAANCPACAVAWRTKTLRRLGVAQPAISTWQPSMPLKGTP